MREGVQQEERFRTMLAPGKEKGRRFFLSDPRLATNAQHSKKNRASRFGKYLGDLAMTLFQLHVFTL